jgi:hypothetical protein
MRIRSNWMRKRMETTEGYKKGKGFDVTPS